MKRVLILNGDSYVGIRVARYFYYSREYDVEVTLSRHDSDLVTRSRHFVDRLDTDTEEVDAEKKKQNARIHSLSVQDTLETLNYDDDDGEERRGTKPSQRVPVELQPFVKAVVPWHNDDLEEFGRRLLANDIIIAVLENDSYEAECAIRILFGSHYEVEKTFVLVSSVLSWANTLEAERAKVRTDRKKAREEELRAFIEENGEDEEVPEELRLQENEEDEDPEDLVPSRTFSEEEYGQRVPHPRFQHWKNLEHMTKHANSETLHTYVLFAGLPYGEGEGPLHNYMRAAFYHQSIPLYGPGDNTVPLIHVADLANIIYKIGSNYDVLEERYMFAVDRGNLTQRQLLECLQSRMGGCVVPQGPRSLQPAADVDMINVQEAGIPRAPTSAELERHFGDALWSQGATMLSLLTDIKVEPSVVLNYHEEEDWVALDGLAASIDRVVFEFRKVRDVKPLRLFVTGPPLSGKETTSNAIAQSYHVPLITAGGAIECYETHVREVREELRCLLVRRLERRRERRHLRRLKQLHDEQAARQQEKAAAAAAAKEQGDEEGDEEEEEEEEEEEGEEREDGSPALAVTKQYPGADADDAVSELSAVFPEEAELRPAESVVDERYLLGPDAGEDEGEEGDVEEAEDEAEEEELFMEEEPDEDGNGGVTLAQRAARAAIRAADAKELARIAQLRHEYTLGLRVLNMKMTNGKLPQPPPEIDEEEEERQAAELAAREAARAKKATRREERRRRRDRGAGDDEEDEAEEEEDDEGEEEDEEGLEEEEEEEEEEEDGTAKGGKVKAAVEVRYLDEAVAFMVRWRLRQADCRNQGFVLDSFPATVRQATLLFMADSEEEAELRSRRVLSPQTTEEVPPPEDANFPLFAPEDMDDEARANLERQILHDDLPLPAHVTDTEEGVFAPVREDFFPDRVLVLTEKDEVLQSLAANILDSINLAVLRRPDSQARPTSTETARDQDGNPLQTVTHFRITEGAQPNITAQLTYKDGKVISRREEGVSENSMNSLKATQSTGGSQYTASEAFSNTMRAAEKLEFNGFPKDYLSLLEFYRRHHEPAGPPSRSLLTWLQGVATTAPVGARAEPVTVNVPKGADDNDDDDAAADAYAMDEEEEQAALARRATVTFLQAPSRDLTAVTEELKALQARRLRERMVNSTRSVPARLAAGNTRYEYREEDGKPDEWDYVLGFRAPAETTTRKSFAKKKEGEAPNFAAFVGSAREELLPPLPHYGPPFDDSNQRQANELAIEAEKQRVGELSKTEKLFQHEAEEELAAALEQERFLLRRVQISEESLGAWRSAQLPMDTYLMEYVVPSLTPAMASVVRLRPEDPVSVLADILFNYKRRTRL